MGQVKKYKAIKSLVSPYFNTYMEKKINKLD